MLPFLVLWFFLVYENFSLENIIPYLPEFPVNAQHPPSPPFPLEIEGAGG